jgi:hypothetical protein
MIFSFCGVGEEKVADTEAEQGEASNDTKEVSAISSVIADYTGQSTVHGMKYLGERRRHWTEKYDLLFCVTNLV